MRRWECLSCQTMNGAGASSCSNCGADSFSNSSEHQRYWFVGDDGHAWRVTAYPSAACGANYADVERVDGTKTSVRQAELLRRTGMALPEASG